MLWIFRQFFKWPPCFHSPKIRSGPPRQHLLQKYMIYKIFMNVHTVEYICVDNCIFYIAYSYFYWNEWEALYVSRKQKKSRITHLWKQNTISCGQKNAIQRQRISNHGIHGYNKKYRLLTSHQGRQISIDWLLLVLNFTHRQQNMYKLKYRSLKNITPALIKF